MLLASKYTKRCLFNFKKLHLVVEGHCMPAMRRSGRGSESGGAWAREKAKKRQKRRPGTPGREGPGESGNVLDAAFPGPPGPSQRVFWEFK